MASIAEISSNNLDAYIDLIPEVLREQSLEFDGFHFYGIEEAGEAAGVVCLRLSADIAEIKYVYMLPFLRGTGIIDQMLAYLFVLLRDDDYTQVTMKYIPEEYPFFRTLARRFGFTEHRMDYAYFRFKVEDILKCRAASFEPQGIMRLKYLPADKKNMLIKMVEKRFNFYDYKLSLKEEDVMPYSLAYLDGETPKGVLVVDDPRSKNLPTSDDIKRYPEPGAYELTLYFVGNNANKAPLYLLSGLCKMVEKEFPPETTLTGFFPEGHVVQLIENTLNVKGYHEVKAILDLRML